MKDIEIVIVTAIVSSILTYLWMRSRKPKAIVQTFGKNPTYYDIVYTDPVFKGDDPKGASYGIKEKLNEIAQTRGINIRFNNPTKMNAGNSIQPDWADLYTGHLYPGNKFVIVKASDLRYYDPPRDGLSTKKKYKLTGEWKVYSFDQAYKNFDLFMDTLLASGVID